MSREDDKKIAEWVGWKNNKYGFFTPPGLDPNAPTYPTIPNYTTNDSAAITLLPVLVEKKYHPELYLSRGDCLWSFRIWQRRPDEPGGTYDVIAFESGGTIAASITSAILSLIAREGKP
jgi:hypothetical protein